jgi:hypothetical protein
MKPHTRARCVHCHTRLTPRESADAYTCDACLPPPPPPDRAAFLVLLAAVCVALALLVGRLI